MFRKWSVLWSLCLITAVFSCSSQPLSPASAAKPDPTAVGDRAPLPSATTEDAEAPTNLPDAKKYDELVIVGTNDFHGYLRPVEAEMPGGENLIQGGAEWLAGYIRILEKRYGNNLVLLDAGDLFQGTMESNAFQGKSVIDAYNQLPYRASAVGNHEFDYGPVTRGDPDRLGTLKKRISEAHFPFLQANIFLKDHPNQLWREKNLQPTAMIKAGGYKIGIIGLTTTTTLFKTLPINLASLVFKDFLKPTLEQAKALRAKGADFVIITTHEGGNQPGTPVYELLKVLPKGTVDAVVSGHYHMEIHEMMFGVPVIQSRARDQFFGRIDLFVNKATRKIDPKLTKIHDIHWICGSWLKNNNSCDAKSTKDALASNRIPPADLFPLRKATYEGEEVHPDARVHDVLTPYFAEVDRKKKEVLGEASRDFNWYPSGETEMGDLWTHAFHDRFPEARVIYLNGGGFRRRLMKGDITFGDIYEVHPFDNYAVLVKMNGRELKDLVRVGVSGANSLPAIWGVNAEYYGDTKAEYDRDVNSDGKKEAWERNRLVPHGLTWQDTGKEVLDEDVFWLATNDYLVGGGDNTDHVFKGIPMDQRKYQDIIQRDVAVEYLRANPGIGLPFADESHVHKIP